MILAEAGSQKAGTGRDRSYNGSIRRRASQPAEPCTQDGMHAHSLERLEFDKVLAQLAWHCAFQGGADRARALQPSRDLRAIQANLQLAAEAYEYLAHQTEPSFGGVKDITGLTARAQRRIVLQPSDLFDIHLLLDRTRTLQRTFTRHAEDYPGLAQLAGMLQPCSELSAEIARCIHERGEVMSQASPQLGRIRAELRREQERLVRMLDRLASNPDLQPYLQDSIVTQRQGRYVVPVRSEYRSKLPGIVHDQSASGATTFIEPLGVVDQNNEVRALELAERKEVERILMLLSETAAEMHAEIQLNVSTLSELDFVLAKARYAYAIGGELPEMFDMRPDNMPLTGAQQGDDAVSHPGSRIWLRQARHPLLPPDEAVPLDFELGPTTGPTGVPACQCVVITGPNTGGKTVALKTVALMILMAQSGLLIPAGSGSQLGVFDNVYADIGDEQSIEQSLSTFSSHLTNIVGILEESTPRSLVILDEVGAGTDPEEGSALAAALLEHLRRRRVTTLASTHYSEIKLYAHSAPGVCNAAMEFDVESLRPTFKLQMGLPGKSNALTIARHLGLAQPVVELAESQVRADAASANTMLEDIRLARQRASEERDEAVRERELAQLAKSELLHRLSSVEEDRRAVLTEARAQAAALIEDTRAELQGLRRQADADFRRSGRQEKRQVVDAARGRLTEMEEDLPASRASGPPPPAPLPTGKIAKGDTVWIRTLQATGTVAADPQPGRPVEVQAGQMRLKTSFESLELRQRAAPERFKVSFRQAPRPAEVTMELDIRGARVEPGVARLDRYLEEAYLSRLPWVRIIHGKGTGQLRTAVRGMLRSHPHIAKSRTGEAEEGGDGVTVATLQYD